MEPNHSTGPRIYPPAPNQTGNDPFFQDPLGDAQPSPSQEPLVEIDHLSLRYGTTQALSDVTIPIHRNAVTALIGPSGCGKSSLLRCINRMNDHIPQVAVTGEVRFMGQNLYAPHINPIRVRRHIGMVFQRSNPFPKSVFENVAFGLRLHKVATTKSDISRKVEESLLRAGLWEEVKDRLHINALTLSGGQQQRLCIARAIAIEPKILLMDEPASALDPIATARIEDLIRDIKQDYTIAIVTHNLQQAGRCSDHTAFLYMGALVEFGPTETIFSAPMNEMTENYISGRFG